MWFSHTDSNKASKTYIRRYVLPGHGRSAHFITLVASPGHFFPPCAGAGLSQYRVLVFCPKPQVVEQELQAFQLPHCPSTESEILQGNFSFS